METTNNPETKDLIKLSRLDRKDEYYKDILDNPKMFQQKNASTIFHTKLPYGKTLLKENTPIFIKLLPWPLKLFLLRSAP